MNSLKKYIAEFIGTAILVLVACGIALNTGGDLLATALGFGLVIVAMAYSIGNISGCHINPAVSLAMLLCKKLSLVDFAGYVVAQFAGGIAGAYLLGWLTNPDEIYGCANLLNEQLGVDMARGLVIEVILTFIFVIAILGVTAKKENASVSGVVIGLTLALVHIMGIPFTGTSVNPARSFGPALIAGGDQLSQVWIFIAAPLVGAVLAVVVYALLNGAKLPKREKKEIKTDDALVDAYVNAFGAEEASEAPVVEVPVDSLVVEILDSASAE